MILGRDIREIKFPYYFPKKSYLQIIFTVKKCLCFWNDKHEGQLIDLEILFQDIPILSPFVKIDEGKNTIHIPISLLTRIWYISHLSIRNFNDEGIERKLLYDPFDYQPSSSFYVPKRFRPLFKSYIFIEEHFKDLQEALSISKIELMGYNAINNHMEVLNMSSIMLFFIVFHEIAHVSYKHDKIIENFDYSNSTNIKSENDLLKALEIHADCLATRMTIKYVLSLHDEQPVPLRVVSLVYLRFSYSIVLLLSLFECDNHFIHDPLYDQHNHQIIRYELIKSTLTTTSLELASQSENVNLFKMIEMSSNLGWVKACSNLNKEMIKAKEDIDLILSKLELAPIHSMLPEKKNIDAFIVEYFKMVSMYSDYLDTINNGEDYPLQQTKFFDKVHNEWLQTHKF